MFCIRRKAALTISVFGDIHGNPCRSTLTFAVFGEEMPVHFLYSAQTRTYVFRIAQGGSRYCQLAMRALSFHQKGCCQPEAKLQRQDLFQQHLWAVHESPSARDCLQGLVRKGAPARECLRGPLWESETELIFQSTSTRACPRTLAAVPACHAGTATALSHGLSRMGSRWQFGTEHTQC